MAEEFANAALDDSDKASTSSVYASVFYASQLESVPDDTTMKVMKVLASETDFRRRLRLGDSIEYFFDVKDGTRTDRAADLRPGELLYTAITSDGETYSFYRFRTPEVSTLRRVNGRVLRRRARTKSLRARMMAPTVPG